MKNILKIFSLILCVIVVLCCVGCSGDSNSDTANAGSSNVSSGTISETSSSNASSGGTSETNSSDVQSSRPAVDPSKCSHTYESKITKYPRVFDEGEKTYTCKDCKNSYTESISKSKTLKVLALGNSYSKDSMQYLWDVANNAGVENIILGNLYVSGCNLDQHWEYISNFTPKYVYYKNTTGEWKTTSNYTVAQALDDEEWDIISVQQSSGNSALPDSFTNFDNVISYLSVSEPNARIVWNMTWSYQHDNTKHGVFKQFDRDPVKMYNAIVSTVKSKVQPDDRITDIIPVGTAVQNLRSSYIGDNICRDTYHMSYSHGRYLLALTWFAKLTGGNVDDITWLPSEYPELANDIAVIRQSVKDAIKTPLAITEQAKTK